MKMARSRTLSITLNYDVEISPLDHDGCTVSLVRKAAEMEIVHTPDEYDFPDRLYQDYWENAEAYGVIGDAGELLACIEVCPEEWSNRLMVTELWVSEPLRGKGIGFIRKWFFCIRCTGCS